MCFSMAHNQSSVCRSFGDERIKPHHGADSFFSTWLLIDENRMIGAHRAPEGWLQLVNYPCYCKSATNASGTVQELIPATSGTLWGDICSTSKCDHVLAHTPLMHVLAHLSVSTSRVQTEDVFTGVSIDSVSLGQYSRKEK